MLPAVATLVLLVAGLGLLGTVMESVTDAESGGGVLLVLGAQIALYVLLIGVAVWTAVRFEHGEYTDFGLDVDAAWGRNFVVGTGITVVGVSLSLGWAQLRGLRDVSLAAGGVSGSGGPLVLGAVLVVFVGFILLGNVYEEVVYRRIMIQNFAAGLAARGASAGVAVVLATATSLVLFGLYHVPLRGNVVVAIDAALVGITFALAYLLTGDLGLPIGIHFGRLPIEVIHGLTLGSFEVSAVVEITRNTLLANLEVKLVRIGLICGLIVAWVYVNRGGIGLDETVFGGPDDRSVDDS